MFVLFFLSGLTICFAGRALFKPVLFIVGVWMAVSLIMLLFYSTFLKSNTKAWVGWVVLASALLLGCILGWLMVKIARLGAFIVAGWGGYAVGLLLYNAFAYKMNSNAGFWGFTLGTALLFGILALCFFDHILILATSIFGSFLTVYGLGLVCGRYTNPFTVATLIENGQIDHIDPVFYAYMAGNLVLCAMGVVFQYRHKNGNPDHDPYGDARKYRSYH